MRTAHRQLSNEAGVAATVDPEIVELLEERARFIRRETIRLSSIAKVGYHASTFSCAEILSTLFYGVLTLRPEDPGWTDRDRFILGRRQSAVALHQILADLDFLDRDPFEQYSHALSAGLGSGLAGRLAGRPYNSFVLLGDGERDEGRVWEAATAAAYHQVGRLIAIVARDRCHPHGEVDEAIGIGPLGDRWRASGWDVHEVDGHAVGALCALLRQLAGRQAPTVPAVVLADMVEGTGVHIENETEES